MMGELQSKQYTTGYALSFIMALAAVLPSITAPVLSDPPRLLIALPESPSTGFNPLKEDYGVRDFIWKYGDCRYVGLLFGPDLVNEYRGYEPDAEIGQHFKIGGSHGTWKQKDLKRLVSELHLTGRKAILSVYFLSIYTYEADWVLIRHPEILWKSSGKPYTCGDICPFAELSEDPKYGIQGDTPYYIFFARQALHILEDFCLDGLLLYELGKRGGHYSEDEIDGFVETYRYISEKIHESNLVFMTEDFFSQYSRVAIDTYLKIIPLVDAFIVQTYPYAKGVYMQNKRLNIEYYLDRVGALHELLPEKERSKLLFTLETMDAQEGWSTPPLQLRYEMERLIESGLFNGFIVNHANMNYSGYWIVSEAYLLLQAPWFARMAFYHHCSGISVPSRLESFCQI